ncbi:MAG: glycosyltransferase family 2 protein [Burkholderiales bacterium]|nr:glycosyltransferase family 2 protein [Burkholderiales bacterium]
MSIGVMVLNYNGSRWLAPLYTALRQQTCASLHVYLVDNASQDNSVPLTQSDFPEVTVLRMPRNLGYSMAYNAALAHALADGCEWVIWANNDIRLEPDCIAELARAACQDENIGILGPAFLGWDNDEPNYYMKGAHPQAINAMRRHESTPLEVDWVEGSFLMVSRRCIEDTGPLDPYLYFYWEEADFCRRARFNGWKVALVPSALARHYAGGSTASEKSGKFDRLKKRNYYIFTLANPNQAWGRNLIDAMHLLLVRLKAGWLRREVEILDELKVFFSTLSAWRTIRNKWHRDRSGGQPPSLSADEGSVQVEIIRGRESPA